MKTLRAMPYGTSHKNSLTCATIATMLFLSIVCIACSQPQKGYLPQIDTLDSLISLKPMLEGEKLLRINNLRKKAENAVSLTDKYLANSLLYDEYVIYQSDSAMKYADLNVEIAQRLANPEWLTKSKINRSALLAATGLLTQSADEIESINHSTLTPQLLVDYYGQMVFLYSHMGNYAGGDANDYYVLERTYKDSVMMVIDSSHPEYLWYKGWDVLGTSKDASQVMSALRERLDNSPLDSRQDAKNAYVLAKLYSERGDTDNSIKYMAMSAMADVRTVNAEISSLEDLASLMFSQGDIDHAYDYINYSLNKALAYPNRVKALSISRTLDTIYNAYQEKGRREQQRTRVFLLLACILAAVLIVSISVIISQNRKLKRQGINLDEANKCLSHNNKELSDAQSRLNEANSRLKELNSSLKAKNEELNEANYVKEEYIGYVFTICSNYISKLEELKRDIHVKVLAKKYREVADETADLDMKEELKDFYKSFDSIFLHIYPNFVNDFNTLLQEDKRIYPKDGELLNTELRIYALVRLGITDSVKIAEFLHCSTQTVYNNRFKVRNKALISKKDFADTVRKLGKYLERTS